MRSRESVVHEALAQETSIRQDDISVVSRLLALATRIPPARVEGERSIPHQRCREFLGLPAPRERFLRRTKSESKALLLDPVGIAVIGLGRVDVVEADDEPAPAREHVKRIPVVERVVEPPRAIDPLESRAGVRFSQLRPTHFRFALVRLGIDPGGDPDRPRSLLEFDPDPSANRPMPTRTN